MIIPTLENIEITGIVYKTNNTEVFTATLQNTNIPEMCVKILEVESNESAIKNFSEFNSLLSLNHENILLPFHALFKYQSIGRIKSFVVFMEYCPEGDLETYINYLNNNKLRLDEDTIISYAFQLISALAYLQRKNFCHRDIKPLNILLKDNMRVLKIIDFGISKKIVSNKLTVGGTLKYLSPILLKAFSEGKNIIEHNPFKSDVYSLGITLLQITTLKPTSTLSLDNLQKIFKKLPEEYVRVKNLIVIMLKYEEGERPDFIELEQNFDEYIDPIIDIHCNSCNAFIKIRYSHYENSEYICEDCRSKMRCYYCNKICYITDKKLFNGKYVCEDCFRYKCEGCFKNFRLSNGRLCEGEFICDMCLGKINMVIDSHIL